MSDTTCKLISQKELHDEEQRKKEMKKKLAMPTKKEIKLTVGIGESDLNVKIRHAKELIEKKGAVVRISISNKRYRHRHMKPIETQQELMNKVMEHLTEVPCIVKSTLQIASTARGEVLFCDFSIKKSK